MVRLLKRFVQRLLVFALGVLTVWLIVFVIFKFADHRLPWILAVAVTYGIAAYIVLPRAVRMGLKILQRKRVPSYTITGDGLPGDPVNVVLVGTLQQLRAAFAIVGWSEADRLGLKSSWRMIRAFVLNAPYPRAPFSTLYLFGRGQDVGFQKPIGNSPRKRDHIRFWALGLPQAEFTWGTAGFWLVHRPSAGRRARSLGRRRHQRHRFLVDETHVPDHTRNRFRHTNAVRDYIIAELTRHRAIADVNFYEDGEHLPVERVNHYVTDGKVVAGKLGY